MGSLPAKLQGATPMHVCTLTPKKAFELLKQLNPTLVRIHHPGHTGTMQNEHKLHYRVYAVPQHVYFAFETEVVWPQGVTEYPEF